MRCVSYIEAVAELEKRQGGLKKSKSLKPTRQGLRRMSTVIDPRKIVLVAGTNGKGSVGAVLEALLSSAGQKVGLFTSPHLVHATERFRLNGRDISKGTFAESFNEVMQVTHDLNLTHFEILTLMAVNLFCRKEKVDRLVLEVGLGGQWDPTNAIPHQGAVMTRLGLDHQDLLGASLAEIAKNKLGILPAAESPDFLFCHAPFDVEINELISETRAKSIFPWIETEGYEYFVKAGPRFFIKTIWGEMELPLKGLRGAENTALALTTFKAMGYSPQGHINALKAVNWPGRMERIHAPGHNCPIFLSGDHNPQGIGSLVEILSHYEREHLHVLVGVGKEKNLDEMLMRLFEIPGALVYLTQTAFKSRTENEYGAWVSRTQGFWADPVDAMAHLAKKAGDRDLIVVTGSLYLVGLVRNCFSRAHWVQGFVLPGKL